MQFLGVVCILCGLSLVSNASALTYQDGSDIQFTFNSTLSISLSDADIVIGNLIPGQDDTSNAVDVVINTNNLYGYTLTATVGSATKDYRDLRHTNGTANFASIDVNSDLSTLSGQSSSVWGYTISTNGTTWSNFNGLPKYDDTTNTVELNVTDGAAADSTTSFKIGAYAAEGQLAGDYTNVINFKVVSNVGKIYIQDVTTATCPTEPTIVYDRRDEEEYTIQKLADNKCWLLDNLRLDLIEVSLESLKGNTNATDISLEYLKGVRTGTSTDQYAMRAVSNGWDYSSSNLSSPAIYTGYKDMMDSGPTGRGYAYSKYGIHYNYCAASAGSFCYGNGQTLTTPPPGDAIEDICPAGWRMGSSSEFQSLFDAYSDDFYQFVDAFHATLSGAKGNGSYAGGVRVYGYVWTSTKADDRFGVYMLMVLSDDAVVRPQQYALRDNASGYSVRCVAK